MRLEELSIDVPYVTLQSTGRLNDHALSVDQIAGARLATEGPTLRAWLGRAATDIFDRLVLSSPEGAVELNGGWIHHRVAANWKVVMENETDGYHPKFVHASVFSVAQSNLQEIYDERAGSRVRDLGGGHTELDHAPHYRATGKRLDWLGDSPSLAPYIEAMVAAHGEEQAKQILVDGPPHALIFPNLFISEGFLLFIETHWGGANGPALDADLLYGRR